MSEVIAFDTHRFVKNLTASGFTEAQAEALAEEQVHLLNSNLTTKADIQGVKSELEVKIEQVRTELEAKIEQVRTELEAKIEQVRAGVETAKADLQRDIEKARADLSRWMLTGWVTQTGLIATLVWYLFSGLPGG